MRRAQPVVAILGMHRSGTSVLSRCIGAFGVPMPKSLLPTDSGNPLGYWEDRCLVRINDSLLNALGVRWCDTYVPSVDLCPPHIASELRGQARRYVSAVYGRDGYVYKDPRACLVWPFWEEVFRGLGLGVKCLLCVRNPWDVAASLAARDGLPMSTGVALWMRHVVDGMQVVIPNGGLVIDYDLLLMSPEVHLRRIQQWLGGGFNASVLSSIAAAHIRPELHHHRSGPSEAGGRSAIVKSLYDWTHCLASGDQILREEGDGVLTEAKRWITHHTSMHQA